MICLPKSITAVFRQALKSGTIDPEKLSAMTSDERHNFLEQFVGKDNAADVNALFESKLLLKDQQTGIINWAKETAGLKPEVQRDIIARVNKMDTVLNPTDQAAFLNDLANKKLGTDVSLDEAQQISQLSKTAMAARAARDASPTDENILNYGKAKGAFGDYLDSLKPPKNAGFKDTLINVLNIPKSMLTSIMHFSAAGVQGWGMMTTDDFWKAAVNQFKYFASEDTYKDAQAMISGNPDYDTAKAAGLGLTSIDGKLNDREEAIQSSLVQKASTYVSDKTGLPDVVRASSRAFTGFMNDLRFGRFEDLMNAARLKGVDVSKGADAPEDFANVVNSFSGRGKLPFGLDRVQGALNTMFFSPRKMMGAVDMFNPMTYLDTSIDPIARQAAFRQLTGSVLATGAVLALAKMSGLQVETNPIGTNFGKVKIGNSTIDVTGGNASYVRLLAQIITQKEKSSTGKVTTLGAPIYTTSKTGKQVKTPYTAPTTLDQFMTYGRDHLSPVVSTLVDWAAGSNVVGQPFSWKQEAQNELTPLTAQAFYDMYKNDPQTFAKIWPALPSIFGYSTQSEAPTVPKTVLPATKKTTSLYSK